VGDGVVGTAVAGTAVGATGDVAVAGAADDDGGGEAVGAAVAVALAAGPKRLHANTLIPISKMTLPIRIRP
jgi:hypothetical protein